MTNMVRPTAACKAVQQCLVGGMLAWKFEDLLHGHAMRLCTYIFAKHVCTDQCSDANGKGEQVNWCK